MDPLPLGQDTSNYTSGSSAWTNIVVDITMAPHLTTPLNTKLWLLSIIVMTKKRHAQTDTRQSTSKGQAATQLRSNHRRCHCHGCDAFLGFSKCMCGVLFGGVTTMQLPRKRNYLMRPNDRRWLILELGSL
jgi:hypothetical protein